MVRYKRFFWHAIHVCLNGLCYLVSLRRPHYEKRLGERQGVLVPWPRTACKRYWIHGSSLGEMRLALILEKMIHDVDPSAECVMTSMTPSGSDLCSKMSQSYHCYLPYDTPLAIDRFLKNIQPDMLFIIETELWPCLLKKVSKASIPIHIVNARLGIGSRRLHAILRFIKPMMKYITSVVAQSHDDAQSFLDLGASVVSSFGNLKWCMPIPINEKSQYSMKRWCLMAASVQLGEKSVLLQAWKHMRQKNKPCQFIIAPRRLETLHQWQLGWGDDVRVVLSSVWQGEDCDIVLIDTFGQMDRFYPLADVVLVGGSWVKHGGQSVLEPAMHAKCIMIGPSDYNFSLVVSMLKAKDALIQCATVKEWLRCLDRYYANHDLASQMGLRANQFLLQMNLATKEEYFLWLKEILLEQGKCSD